jgi:tetratricopeptide (TPR) repeat protein
VLSGTAGVGKTALALHWAHRASPEFPDGQLFVNLHGFGPAGTALEPADALRGFLEALGVPQARIPADLAARAGLYRSLLTGKQVLVVLDNARDAGQVRPLLPGAPRCAAIITSRSQLAGLAATEGASHLTLDLLTPADGRELLVSRLGGNRVAREPAAVTSIIDRCARLPLALTITAARATTAPNFSLAAIAAELGDASRALDPFQGGDAATDVRSVFSWSYRALSPGAARLFRLLGLHPGPAISVPAAASLGEIETGQARLLLAELSRAHLVAEFAPGSFAFHDLLRAYAAEQAGAVDSQPVRDAAARRLLDHYLTTAYGAAMLIEPHMDPLDIHAAGAGVVPAPLTTAQDALSWFAAERAGLLAAVRLAGDTGPARYAWQLAWCACAFLLRRGLWDDNVLAQEAGLTAARRVRDASGEAHTLHGLALGYARSGRFGEATPRLERALSLYRSTGDRVGQARIHNSLTWIAEHEERLADALVHATRALEIYRAAGHRAGEGMVLNDLGFCHARLGNYRQAREYCEQGLAMARQGGERNWEAAALDSLGLVYHGLGDQRRAVACYEQAAALYRELGDRFNEADTLVSLGDIERRVRDIESARKAWSQAALIFDEIGHPEGDEVRAKLARAEFLPRAEGEAPGAGTPG